MVVTQKLHGGGTIASMLWCNGGCILRSKSVEELNLLHGLEPAPLTSEALVAQ
jgi:hypothetical protein